MITIADVFSILPRADYTTFAKKIVQYRADALLDIYPMIRCLAHRIDSYE